MLLGQKLPEMAPTPKEYAQPKKIILQLVKSIDTVVQHVRPYSY